MRVIRDKNAQESEKKRCTEGSPPWPPHTNAEEFIRIHYSFNHNFHLPSKASQQSVAEKDSHRRYHVRYLFFQDTQT